MPSLTMPVCRLAATLACAAAIVSTQPAAAGDPLAKIAFGAEKLPAAPLSSIPIRRPNRNCPQPPSTWIWQKAICYAS